MTELMCDLDEFPQVLGELLRVEDLRIHYVRSGWLPDEEHAVKIVYPFLAVWIVPESWRDRHPELREVPEMTQRDWERIAADDLKRRFVRRLLEDR